MDPTPRPSFPSYGEGYRRPMQSVRRLWERLMTIGEYPGESDIQRGKRRIIVGYFIFGPLVRVAFVASGFGQDAPWLSEVLLGASLAGVVALLVLRARPDWFIRIVQVMLFAQLVENLLETVTPGGLVPSGVSVSWGILAVVASLIVLGVRPAVWWFLGYQLTIVLAVLIPGWVDPDHFGAEEDVEIALTVGLYTTFVFASMSYFVHQRDVFQKESDDLLHSILPNEIARRLKAERTMIADDYEGASVLFADLAGFTPMSAKMTPPELVGLLNQIFTVFDRFVDDLGLEKIKTVGDEYMVAAGVPVARPDHAEAIAELALRIRDHVLVNDFDGHRIRVRIGINSGPVVAGIVGTQKFAYDLWGDAVNTASRMESSGIVDAIQVSPATYALIKDVFECEPRGTIEVKGKGQMMTYILIGRLGQPATT